MMFGVHINVSPSSLNKIVQLHKHGKILCQKNLRIIGEYVYAFKFLVIIVELTDLSDVLAFTTQFSTYSKDIEVGISTNFKNLVNI